MTDTLNKDVSKWTEDTYTQLYNNIKSHLKLQDASFSIFDETKKMEMEDIDDLIYEYQSREDDQNFNVLHLNVITQTSPITAQQRTALNNQATHPQQRQHPLVLHQSHTPEAEMISNLMFGVDIMQPPISPQQQRVLSIPPFLSDPESTIKPYVYFYCDAPFISMAGLHFKHKLM